MSLNYSFSVFGTPNGFDELPTDNNKQILVNVDKNSVKKSRLLVSRSGYLITYSFIKNLSSNSKTNNYFGLSLRFNSVYCNDIKWLYKQLETIYEVIIKREKWLEKNNREMAFCVKKFQDQPEELNIIKQKLQVIFEKYNSMYFSTMNKEYLNKATCETPRKYSLEEAKNVLNTVIKEYSFVDISPEYEVEKKHNKIGNIILIGTILSLLSIATLFFILKDQTLIYNNSQISNKTQTKSKKRTLIGGVEKAIIEITKEGINYYIVQITSDKKFVVLDSIVNYQRSEQVNNRKANSINESLAVIDKSLLEILSSKSLNPKRIYCVYLKKEKNNPIVNKHIEIFKNIGIKINEINSSEMDLANDFHSNYAIGFLLSRPYTELNTN